MLPLHNEKLRHIAGPGPSLGCRIIPDPNLCRLVKTLNRPLLTTSLNITKEPTATNFAEAQAVAEKMKIPCIDGNNMMRYNCHGGKNEERDDKKDEGNRNDVGNTTNKKASEKNDQKRQDEQDPAVFDEQKGKQKALDEQTVSSQQSGIPKTTASIAGGVSASSTVLKWDANQKNSWYYAWEVVT